jgi:hypothetical protein
MQLIKIIPGVLLIFRVTIGQGQSIKKNDLQGLWSIEFSKQESYIKFHDSSKFECFDTSLSFNTSNGIFSLSDSNHQTLLTLERFPGSYAWQEKQYLIQKVDSDSYNIQLVQKTSSGQNIYEWDKIARGNTFFLLKMTQKSGKVYLTR